MDRMDAFDVLYRLAADDGREERLFGSCAPLAREVFAHCLIGDEMPIIWYELPLAGEPRFDLHVALSRTALAGDVAFAPGSGYGYDELFRWYSQSEQGGGGLAFAFDISEGRTTDPAVHVNVNNAPLNDIDHFFELAGGADAPALYRDFTAQIPDDWHVWYAGTHPGRPGSHLRVDCFVGDAATDAYANDLSVFERDLRSVGFSAPLDALAMLATPILAQRGHLELQFDVLRDGSVGPTLGLSAGFPMARASVLKPMFVDGEGAAILTAMEELGLADDRWRLIADAIYTKIIPAQDGAFAFYNIPTFIKLRMRDGAALDAKVYMQAGAQELESGGSSS